MGKQKFKIGRPAPGVYYTATHISIVAPGIAYAPGDLIRVNITGTGFPAYVQILTVGVGGTALTISLISGGAWIPDTYIPGTTEAKSGFGDGMMIGMTQQSRNK